MTDKLTCPFCERSFDIEAVEGADLFRERAEIAAKLGPLWGPANEYIDCFRASRGARLNLKRRVRILGEIKRLWESGEFEYDGKRYRIRQADILAGIQAVCNADKVGFQNHNYLKRVLMPQGSRLSAEGLTSSEEVEREQKRRGGPERQRSEVRGQRSEEHLFDQKTVNREPETLNPDGFLSPAENVRRAREIVAGIGKKFD